MNRAKLNSPSGKLMKEGTVQYGSEKNIGGLSHPVILQGIFRNLPVPLSCFI
jgi:hypothetical protein